MQIYTPNVYIVMCIEHLDIVSSRSFGAHVWNLNMSASQAILPFLCASEKVGLMDRDEQTQKIFY